MPKVHEGVFFILLISNFLFLIFLFLLPLTLYFLLNPADFTARAAAVSIFNPDWNKGDLIGALWQTLSLTLATFLGLNGDPNPLVNLPNQPALPILLVPFFILGLITSLYHIHHKTSPPSNPTMNHEYGMMNNSSFIIHRSSFTLHPPSPHLLLLCWWAMMLLPAILAPEGAPHHLRLIGALVPTYILTALGLVTTANFLINLLGNALHITHYTLRTTDHAPRTTHHGPRILISLLLTSYFLLLAFQTYSHYFIHWPRSVDFTLPFDLYAVRLARDIAQAPPEVNYVLPMDIRAAEEARHYTLD
ncbi:MAG: hypothetical protein L0Y56_08060, partial [Nitrospira sp.]|nr:hypothetical protein [Nitrospira sp.]